MEKHLEKPLKCHDAEKIEEYTKERKQVIEEMEWDWHHSNRQFNSPRKAPGEKSGIPLNILLLEKFHGQRSWWATGQWEPQNSWT